MSLQGYFCVAFVDLLGTNATNQAISRTKEADPDRAARMLAREVGKVEAFRAGFFQHLEKLQSNSTSGSQAALDAHLDRGGSPRGNPLKSYGFSDSTIIHCSLNTRQGQMVPVKSCFWMLLAVALAQLQELSRGNPFRGGIEVDFAATHSDDGAEILGPALSGAVELEKRKAEFPRVVVGPGFETYIKVHAAVEDASAEGRLNRAWAQQCASLIVEDNRGVLSVDVTAPEISRWIGVDLHRTFLDRSASFAREQVDKCRDNPKLHNRYKTLVAYLTDSRE